MKTLPIEKDICKRLGIKISQLMEWATTKIEPRDGEKYVFLEDIRVHVCYKELLK